MTAHAFKSGRLRPENAAGTIMARPERMPDRADRGKLVRVKGSRGRCAICGVPKAQHQRF